MGMHSSITVSGLLGWLSAISAKFVVAGDVSGIGVMYLCFLGTQNVFLYPGEVAITAIYKSRQLKLVSDSRHIFWG